MDTKKYEVFEKTVELSSLTKAAQELGLTQSGVSHMLSAIEAELQLPLLKRTRTGARLTPEGERMMPYIHEIVRQEKLLRQAATSLHTLVTGKIRIGTFTSVATHWLPAMMMQFQKEHPRVDFQLFNGDYHDINTWLEEGSIDIGFVTMPDYPKNCRGIALKEDRLLAVLPKEHPLAGNSSFPVAAVENESFISIMENSANDARRALDMAGVKAHVKYTTKDDYAVIAMVEQGLGISIMPELLLGGLTHNVKLMPLDNRASRIIGAAVPEKNSGNATAQKFIAHMQRWIAARYAPRAE